MTLECLPGCLVSVVPLSRSAGPAHAAFGLNAELVKEASVRHVLH